MSLLTQDYLQLKQVKIFLDKNISISESDINKQSVGQLLLNNSFFKDFDGDGVISYNDYKIAWNWLMQGKPTELKDLQDNQSDNIKVTEMPYEKLQQSEVNILPDHSKSKQIKLVNETKNKPKFKFSSYSSTKQKAQSEPRPNLVVMGELSKINKSNTTRSVGAFEVSKDEVKEEITEANLEVNSSDYSELMKVKKYLDSNHEIYPEDVAKDKIGQQLLNNKYFEDFDNDGKITINDFNIGWNWVMQGKPTSIDEFIKNSPTDADDFDIPYQKIQNTEQSILPSQNINEFKNKVNLIIGASVEKSKRIVFKENVPVETHQPQLNSSDEKFTYNYFKADDSRQINSYEVTPIKTIKKNLELLSEDYKQLEEVKAFVLKHKNISIDDLSKMELNQSLLNNKFFNDFNMDGIISFDDYNIAWNWVMQGKPTDLITFAKNKSATPDTHKIPYQSVQNTEFSILQDNRVVVYDRNTDDQDLGAIISGTGMTEKTGVEIITTGTEEESSDFNEDGEIDEIDLQILECFILMRPDDLCEYNRDRGDCPEATKLPSMLTAKFACDTSYYYGDVHLPGDDLIGDKDIEYYMAWLLGQVEVPDVNTLKFILSNNWVESPYKGPSFREVLRDCCIRDNKSEMTLHSTSIYRVDYRDYLIMKEWLRLDKPNMKGKISDYDALAWFNENSAEGTPLACKLPFEPYMDIGSSCYTFDSHSFEEYL